ncbi:MAG: S8 family serine peptidase, partial [Mycobacterium sp.]|nr:S8 family serine peptidase [Mycobacterium sp.]
ILTNGNTTGGTNATGGRILRIEPNGTVTIFAEGFNTSGAQDSTSFQDSSLSIAFSADGTTLYASDNDAIWQFKTVTSLASATSGSLIGLNDLRTLAVPYDGQGSAVAIVDTGVDANTSAFRGRVANGADVITNGFGNQDNAPGTTSGTTTTTTTNGTTSTAAGTLTSTGADGHGTLVAGVVAQFVPQATIVPVNVFNPFQVSTGFTQTSGSGTTTGTNSGTTSTTGTTVSNTSNAVTSSQNVWKGMKYVATHPYVADPIRPNTVDRVVASTFAFGTLETFASEGDAYRRYPQVVNALKFQLHKFLKLGIAPIAASGELGEPYAAAVASTSSTGGTTTGSTSSSTSSKGSSSGSSGTSGNGNGIFGNDNSDNKNVGDDNGMSLPAILNEVISVTGTIPFPFTALPSTPPTDPPQGVVPRPTGPILVYNGNTIGGTSSSTTSTTTTTSTGGNNLNLLTAGNFAIYSDRILASANRSNTTDFAAPALDVPTFRRTFVTTGTTTGTTTATDNTDNLVFNQSGTSLSAAEVTGAYALVSSALNYWTQLSQANGVTSDAYLTTPVGVDSLNFGAGSVLNLNAWNNPNGINGILAWTAVPVTDANDGLSASTPATITGSNNYKSYARLSVGDAVAAIEGYEALNYLISHNDLQYLESNNNGIITAQSIQEFVNNSAKMGLPEAGAMARLLGGTATTDVTSPTAAGENPDQPGALQRRFNFFDYAADGQLNGGITVSQLQMLAHTLLPTPDAYVVTNRNAASANGFLSDPIPQRNFKTLQHNLPRFEYAPLTLNRSYANSSPAS